MPIIPLNIRFILMAVLLGGGLIISFVPYGLAWSWLLLIPGIILTLGYFFFGTIPSASKLLQEGRLVEAEARLKKTYKPGWLLKFNRGTYYFLFGAIKMQQREMGEAEQYMNQALEIGMPTDDFTAQIYLFLAQMAASKRKLTAARNHMREIKKLNVKDDTVIQAVKQVEAELKKIPKGGGFRQQQQQRQMGGRRKR